MYHIMKYVLYIISVFFLITACKREKIEVNPSQEEEKKEITQYSWTKEDFSDLKEISSLKF